MTLGHVGKCCSSNSKLGRDSALRCPDAAARRPHHPRMRIPDRRRFPDDNSLWGDNNRACYFVTICCARRGTNQLAHDQIAAALFETIKFRNAKGLWYVRLGLVMPDHV